MFSSSRGIFLVDYNLELEKVNKEVTNAEVLSLFHKKLFDADPPLANDEDPEADPMGHIPSESSLTFGRFTIDPRYTDFIGKDFSGEFSKCPNVYRGCISMHYVCVQVCVVNVVLILWLLYIMCTVLPSRIAANDAHSQPDGILPPWAIAVAVLGVVSVVIILILGISVVS